MFSAPFSGRKGCPSVSLAGHWLLAVALVGCGATPSTVPGTGMLAQDGGAVAQQAASDGGSDAPDAEARDALGVMADGEMDSAVDALAEGPGPIDARGGGGGRSSCSGALGGGPVATTASHLDIRVHDPSMVWDGSRYYLLATGGLLTVRSSPDMQTWSNVGDIFGATPPWITVALGSDPKSLWAPDVSYFNGEFHVYYAGSTFGSNNSVIGLATSPTLQASAPGSLWTDRGLVVRSLPSDTFNAIDPNVSFDENCAPWLAFGSFWSGIKLHKLEGITGKLATDDPTTYSIASRNGNAIEAASIISHNGFFYLFVSFDACCQGVNSTYKTMVGRATRITGPYVNKAGVDMMQGGAEPLLVSSGRYIGPGGGTAWKDGATYLYAYHYYDGQANGASKLLVRPILFGADDWITLGNSLFP